MIVTNSLYYLLLQLSTIALGFVVQILVVRTLGPALYGKYFLIQAVTGFLASLANLGIGSSSKYFLVKSKYTLGQINLNSLIYAIFLGGGLLLITLIPSEGIHVYLLKGLERKFILISLIMVPFTLYATYWNSMIMGINKFGLLSVYGIVSNLIVSIAVMFCILALHFSLPGLILLWMISNILSVAAMAYLVHQLDKSKVAFNPLLFKESLVFGLKDHFSTSGYYLYTSLDIFILNAILSPGAYGQYVLAKSLASRVTILPNSLVQSSIPQIGATQRETSVKLTAKVLRHTLFLGMACAIIMAVASPWIIPLLYSSDFRGAVLPFIVILPGHVILLLTVVLSAYFTFQKGKPLISARYSWITVLVSVPLVLKLGDAFGIFGGSIAVSTAYCFVFLLIFFHFKHETQLSVTEAFMITRKDLIEYWDLGKQVYLKALAFGTNK